MKRGETMLVMYLRHGRPSPKGSKVVRLDNHHGHHSALAILAKRKPKPKR